MLSDAQWERLAPLVPGKPRAPDRSGTDNRLFVEAVLWLVPPGRVRAPLCGASRRPGLRAHPYRRHHHTGSPPWKRRTRGTQAQATGRSRGGLTTKIVALVDALGNLARFLLLPSQRHDGLGAEPLLSGADAGALLADKAFDIDWSRATLSDRKAAAVVPSTADRVRPIPYDGAIYPWRHLVENAFCALQAFRCIATRYDKTDGSFRAAIHLAALFIGLK